MATLTTYSTVELPGGARLISGAIIGTSSYVHETGDYLQYSGVTGANAIIMVHPTGLSNGGYSACWTNATNALHYYGPGNIGAVGDTAHNGQPMLPVGNAVNLATHAFPALVIVRPS